MSCYTYTYPAECSRILHRKNVAHDRALLCFRPITFADLPAINKVLQSGDSRTCDYTIGGIYMWADYFAYQYCIVADTLFIKGLTENDRSTPAFSLPIGPLPINDAVSLIQLYCDREGLPVRFSAIPADKVASLTAGRQSIIEPLEDWSDYLYSASELATLSGKRFNKKRNHVNRFMAEHPHAVLQPLTPAIIPQVKSFFVRPEREHDTSETAMAERNQVNRVLDNYLCYPFEGAVLRLAPDGPIAAFTIGEIIADTLYLHIEKMNHEITGSGETINKLFANEMLRRHGIAYINREEDCGDPGLRQAKLSYNPVALLHKQNVTLL